MAVLPAVGLEAGRISGLLLRGVLGFVLVMSVCLLLIRKTDHRVSAQRRQRLRYLGSLTFPLYVIHFPILVAFKASGWWRDHSPWHDLLVLAVVTMAAHALLQPSEAIKHWLTRQIDARLG